MIKINFPFPLETGVSILVAGKQGSGKSAFGEWFLKNFPGRPNYVYDPARRCAKWMKNRAAGIVDRDKFLNVIPMGDGSNANVLLPDASGFFGKGTIPGDLSKHLSIFHHTKNIFISEYHDLSLFSIENLAFIHYLVIFGTTGDPKKVLKKFEAYPHIIKEYKLVQEITAGTNFDRFKKKYLPGYYIDASGKRVERSAEYSKEFHHFHRVIKIQ